MDEMNEFKNVQNGENDIDRINNMEYKKSGKRMQEGKRKNKKDKKDKKENKKKNIILKVFLLGILGIIILSIIAYIANDYIILDKNTTTNLVINNNNITLNLKNDIIIEDDIIYLSTADIANFFDKHIYLEEDINKIITTYDKKVAVIGFEENEIEINGSTKEIYASAMKRDDVTYLPISEMKEVYNIEIEYLEETMVMTIDSLDREQNQALVSGNTAVKSSTNFIAKTVDRIDKGEMVIIISQGESYTKVRTDDGKIGYVKNSKLENTIQIREELEDEKQIEGNINLVWDYFSEYGSAPDRSGTEIEGVNVVSPSFFYLDDDGNLDMNIGQAGIDYIEWAHDNGYKVWPMVSNAEAGLTVTSEVMNSYEKRDNLIEDLIKAVVKYDLDGLNIDFEYMKEEDKDLYSKFIIELTPRIKEIGMVLSVDVTAPDGSPEWSLCYDRNTLGDVADYLIFMAYDQYGASSNKAGTTAGYDWVELSVNKFLTNEGVDAEKLILAVPFYTRIWTETPEGEIVKNSTVTMKNIDSLIPSYAEKVWDEELKQYYVEYPEGNNTKKMWVEDLESLKAKISLINEKNLAGVAAWEKDMESDDVWQMFRQELSL